MSGYRVLSQAPGSKPLYFEMDHPANQHAIYEGYSADPNHESARRRSLRNRSRSRTRGCGCCGGEANDSDTCCQGSCDLTAFPDAELETLFWRYVFTFHRRQLNRFILLHIALVMAAAGLEFAYNPGITYKNVALVSIVTVHLFLFVYANCRLMRRGHMSVVVGIALMMALALVAVSLPVHWAPPVSGDVPRTRSFRQLLPGPLVEFALPDGLWEVVWVIVSLYWLLPVRLLIVAPLCLILSAVHSVCAALTTGPLMASAPQSKLLASFYWKMLGSNLVVLVCAHLVGLLVHRGQERALRAAFLHTRDAVASRLAFQEENDKLERLVRCLVPEPLVPDLRRDFIQGTTEWKVPVVVHLRNISFLSLDICGLTDAAGAGDTSASAGDLVRLLNELFSRCDHLAQDLGCYRVRLQADEYLCLAGYPETRVDHARSCVELAFNVMEVLSSLCDCAEVTVEVRAAVHTGEAFAAVLGNARMAFDLLGEDVQLVRHLQGRCLPGRVLVSKSTFDQLPDGYRAEPGPLMEQPVAGKSSPSRLDTFYIKPRHTRQSSNLNLSLRGLPNGSLPHPAVDASSPNQRSRYPRLAADPNRRAAHLGRLAQSAKYNAEPPFLFFTEESSGQTPAVDFIRKPFKRSGQDDPWRVTLHRYMAETLDQTTDGPMKSTRALRMNPITLRFADGAQEKQYNRTPDRYFGRSLATALVLLMASSAMQAAILPRTVLLLLLFMIAFTWIGMMLLVLVASKLKCLEFNMQSTMAIRLVVIVTSILFVYAVSQVNVFCCEVTPHNHSSSIPALSAQDFRHLQCPLPQYVPLSCILSLLLLAVFLALPAFIKCLLALLMVASYTVVTEFTHRRLFDRYDGLLRREGVPSHVMALVCMLAFFLLVVIQGHFLEHVRRLAFLWKSQSSTNEEETEAVRSSCKKILNTMLPHHVALYFLDTTYRNPVGLYSQEYSCVGVLCASLPTWCPLGVHEPTAVAESIRLLNQLICRFDMMLNEDQFRGIIKIRTVGETCLYAVGVEPQFPIHDNASKTQLLSTLVQFSLAMKQRADEVNASLLEERIRLRMGIHAGGGFCGVTGGSRPVFGLWGEALQVACLLEKCAQLGRIQTTQPVVMATGMEAADVGWLRVVGGQLVPVPPGGPPPMSGPGDTVLRVFVLMEGGGRHHQARRVSLPVCHTEPNMIAPMHSPGVAAPGNYLAGSLQRVRAPTHHHHHRPPQNPKLPATTEAPCSPGVATGVSNGTNNVQQINVQIRYAPPQSSRIQQSPNHMQPLSPAPSVAPPPVPQHGPRSIATPPPAVPPRNAKQDIVTSSIEEVVQAQCMAPVQSPVQSLATSPQEDLSPIGVGSTLSTAGPRVDGSHSSLNTFLALEAACGTHDTHCGSLGGRLSVPNEEEEEGLSHHNPLYTDNEYESMAESQSNLLDLLPPLKPGHTAKATGRSSDNECPPPLPPKQGSGRNSANSPRASLTSSNRSGGSGDHRGSSREDFNFPDYRRPASPSTRGERRNKTGSNGRPNGRRNGDSPAAQEPISEELIDRDWSMPISNHISPPPPLAFSGPMSIDRANLMMTSHNCGPPIGGQGGNLLFTLSENGGAHLTSVTPLLNGFPMNEDQSSLDFDGEESGLLSNHRPGRHGLRLLGDDLDLGRSGAESCFSLVADSFEQGHGGMTSCDEFGFESDLEGMRLYSDMASELSENPVVSDLEDEYYMARAGLFRFPAGNLMADPITRSNGFRSWDYPTGAPLPPTEFQSFPYHGNDVYPLGRYPGPASDLYSNPGPEDQLLLVMPGGEGPESAQSGGSKGSGLPEIAPVRLPDFSQMSYQSCGPSSGSGLLSIPGRPLPVARYQGGYGERLRRRGRWFTGGASSPERSDYDNMGGKGGESDALSGYTGDVASSAYDSDEEGPQHDDLLFAMVNGCPEQEMSASCPQPNTASGRDSSGKRSDYDNLDSDVSESVLEDLRRGGHSNKNTRSFDGGHGPVSSPSTGGSSRSGPRQPFQLVPHNLWRQHASGNPVPPQAKGRGVPQGALMGPQLFDEKIAAEARRISSEFRSQWRDDGDDGGVSDVPASTGGEARASPPAEFLANSETLMSLLGNPPSRKQPHNAVRAVSTLNDYQRDMMAASRNRGARPRVVKNRSKAFRAPYVNLSGSLDIRPSLSAENLAQPTNGNPAPSLGTGPSLAQVVSRIERVRSLLPAELHAYVLPACISSSSVASSFSCGPGPLWGPTGLRASDPGSLHHLPGVGGADSEYDNCKSDWYSDDDLSAQHNGFDGLYYQPPIHPNYEEALRHRFDFVGHHDNENATRLATGDDADKKRRTTVV